MGQASHSHKVAVLSKYSDHSQTPGILVRDHLEPCMALASLFLVSELHLTVVYYPMYLKVKSCNLIPLCPVHSCIFEVSLLLQPSLPMISLAYESPPLIFQAGCCPGLSINHVFDVFWYFFTDSNVFLLFKFECPVSSLVYSFQSLS